MRYEINCRLTETGEEKCLVVLFGIAVPPAIELSKDEATAWMDKLNRSLLLKLIEESSKNEETERHAELRKEYDALQTSIKHAAGENEPPQHEFDYRERAESLAVMLELIRAMKADKLQTLAPGSTYSGCIKYADDFHAVQRLGRIHAIHQQSVLSEPAIEEQYLNIEYAKNGHSAEVKGDLGKDMSKGGRAG